MEQVYDNNSQVLVAIQDGVMTITLNRPEVLNSMNLNMVRLITKALTKAAHDPQVRVVLFKGAGDRAFCAGGDIKVLYWAVKEGRFDEAEAFYTEEFALDLMMHEFKKPIILLADRICMGGGLGLAAGAGLVIATERTRMAMPETQIGFFPDVGATGWLFEKCPTGYPEYLSLTGHDLLGPHCVRVGLADLLIQAHKDLMKY